MSRDPVISLAFLEQPLVKRFAYAAITFINKLAGPESQKLEVSPPLTHPPTHPLPPSVISGPSQDVH